MQRKSASRKHGRSADVSDRPAGKASGLPAKWPRWVLGMLLAGAAGVISYNFAPVAGGSPVAQARYRVFAAPAGAALPRGTMARELELTDPRPAG